MALLLAALLIAGHPLDAYTGFALRWDRAAIAAGEWWRLVTGQLAHLSWAHAFTNAAALLMMLWLFKGAVRPREWWWAAAFSLLAVDAGLWWLEPGLDWYAGASGLLHGLFVTGLAGFWRACERRLAIALAVGLLAKLAFEAGQSPVTGLFPAPVITAAHRYGALGGLFAALPMALAARR